MKRTILLTLFAGLGLAAATPLRGQSVREASRSDVEKRLVHHTARQPRARLERAPVIP